MSLQYFEEKNIFLSQYLFIAISFYLFISISQYREHKCLVRNGPKNDVTAFSKVKSKSLKHSVEKCAMNSFIFNQSLIYFKAFFSLTSIFGPSSKQLVLLVEMTVSHQCKICLQNINE